MIPPGDRSIRNIPVPGQTRRVPPSQPPRQEYYDEEENTEGPPPRRPKLPRRRRSRVWWWLLGAVLVCGALGFLLSTVFEGATVRVTPKSEVVNVPVTVVAQPNAPMGSLAYQTITATQTATTTVAANGSQHVSRAASGVVTIYNTFGPTPQQLVANTRLITQDGKIYRLKDAVSIPGMTKKADGTSAPGTVTASIFADQPGPSYNQTASIPLNVAGFKGDPRFTKFVAQSQGPISNGFVGDEPAVSPADMATAENELKRQLDSSIRSVATSQVPDGFIEVNGSLGVTYTDIAQNPGPNSTVVLSQSTTANLAIVRESDLAATLAKTLADYKGEPIAFSDSSQVSLSLGSNTASSTSGPLNLSVGGTATLVWQFDPQMLKQGLLGKNKSEFQPIIKGFEPSISRASASIRPFWKATFPTEPGKLSIIVAQ